MDDVIIRRKDGENWKTEFEEHFEIDGSGCGAQQLTHDKAGNLAYDGLYRYTFDAWNRLSTVSRAFRYDNGTLETASKIATMRYDGLGRRIEKKTQNSGDWDCTYRYYHDGHRRVEEHNGSGQPLRQYVWGTQYVDELVQVSVNATPESDSTCETAHWALIDANYNVLGMLAYDFGNSELSFTERYEYTPYGERTVYRLTGVQGPTDVALPMLPTLDSERVGDHPYGICDFGMQGKPFGKECGLYGWNARMYHPRLARAMQPDPLGYPDGMNGFEWERGNPVTGLDPTGLRLRVDTKDPEIVWLQSLVKTLARDAKFDQSGYVVLDQANAGDVPAELVWEVARDPEHTVILNSGQYSRFYEIAPPRTHGISMKNAFNYAQSYFTREWDEPYPLVEARSFPQDPIEHAIVFAHELIHAYYRVIKPNRHGTPISNQHVFGEVDAQTGQRKVVLCKLAGPDTRREEFFDVGCSYVRWINPATRRRPPVIILREPTARFTENAIRRALMPTWKRVSYAKPVVAEKADVTDDNRARIERETESRGE